MTDDQSRPPHKVKTEYDGFAMVYASARDKWRRPGTKLTPVCMMVYVALIMRANRADDSCFPSVDVIAEEAACSRRSAIDALKTLQDEGLIGVEPRYRDDRRQTSNLYTIKDVRKNLHNGSQNRGAKNVTPGVQETSGPGVQNLHPNHNHSNQNQITRGTNVPTSKKPSTSGSAKPAKQPSAEDIRLYRLVDAYGQATGRTVNTGRPRATVKGAMKALPKSVTPEDLTACIEWMLSDPFYAERAGTLTANRVVDNYGEWVKKGRPAAVKASGKIVEPHANDEDVDYAGEYADKEL